MKLLKTPAHLHVGDGLLEYLDGIGEGAAVPVLDGGVEVMFTTDRSLDYVRLTIGTPWLFYASLVGGVFPGRICLLETNAGSWAMVPADLVRRLGISPRAVEVYPTVEEWMESVRAGDIKLEAVFDVE